MKLFEKNTYSVVNIFDVTLRPQLNITGAVEVPLFLDSDIARHFTINYTGAMSRLLLFVTMTMVVNV